MEIEKHKHRALNYVVHVSDKKYSQVYYTIAGTDKKIHENEKEFTRKFVKIEKQEDFVTSLS